MSLAFLTPDALGERVVARSPMERGARAAGAHMAPRDGWSVAVAYAAPEVERTRLNDRVAFIDRSHLHKLELQAERGVLARVIAAASAGGPALEPGAAVRARGAWWCPVTPTRALVLGEPGRAAEIRATVAKAAVGEAAVGEAAVAEAAVAVAGPASADAPGPAGAGAPRPTITVADLTCGLAALELAGPGARELLARFCAIDVRPAVMPVGAFRPGSVARTPGYVLRDGEQRLLVLVGWALGEYLWMVVADAAEHLGGGPAGADAHAEWLESQEDA